MVKLQDQEISGLPRTRGRKLKAVSSKNLQIRRKNDNEWLNMEL